MNQFTPKNQPDLLLSIYKINKKLMEKEIDEILDTLPSERAEELRFELTHDPNDNPATRPVLDVIKILFNHMPYNKMIDQETIKSIKSLLDKVARVPFKKIPQHLLLGSTPLLKIIFILTDTKLDIDTKSIDQKQMYIAFYRICNNLSDDLKLDLKDNILYLASTIPDIAAIIPIFTDAERQDIKNFLKTSKPLSQAA